MELRSSLVAVQVECTQNEECVSWTDGEEVFSLLALFGSAVRCIYKTVSPQTTSPPCKESTK